MKIICSLYLMFLFGILIKTGLDYTSRKGMWALVCIMELLNILTILVLWEVF